MNLVPMLPAETHFRDIEPGTVFIRPDGAGPFVKIEHLTPQSGGDGDALGLRSNTLQHFHGFDWVRPVKYRLEVDGL